MGEMGHTENYYQNAPKNSKWKCYAPFRHKKPESNHQYAVGGWSQVAATHGDAKGWFKLSNDGLSSRLYRTRTHEAPPPGPYINMSSPQERVQMSIAINVAQQAREYNNIDLENGASYIKGVLNRSKFPDDDMCRSLHRQIFELNQLKHPGYEDQVRNLRRWLLETTRGNLEARWDEIMLVHSGRVARADAREDDERGLPSHGEMT
jgi:hypothetical protein